MTQFWSNGPEGACVDGLWESVLTCSKEPEGGCAPPLDSPVLGVVALP